MYRTTWDHGRLCEAGKSTSTIGKVLADKPAPLSQAQHTAAALGEMAQSGLRLDDETVRQLAAEKARRTRWGRLALWVVAISVAVIAVGAL